MFTIKEKKNLTKLLSRVVDPDYSLNLVELHGFLFGLAITPGLIKPSEWLPIAFGEEMMEFESEAEAQELMGHLFIICNRFYAENHDDKLACPFSLDTLKRADLSKMRDWTYGLYHAMLLRYEIWGLGDRDEEDFTEDDQEFANSLAIILGVANPEHIPELLGKEGHDPETNDDDLELEAALLALPDAVKTVQEYAKSISKEQSVLEAE